jgi:hypothetical protein
MAQPSRVDEGLPAVTAMSVKKKRGDQHVSLAETTYADGQPFDPLQYFQSKIILKPDRFTSVKSFRDFGKVVRRAAKHVDVDFELDRAARRRPRVREVVFIDTPDFRLYNNGFILRRRISYVDGFAVGEPEIVFKFRYSEELTAAAVDVRPKIQGSYRIKFKVQELPLTNHIGGYRVLYSHNCQFPLTHVHEADRTAMSTLSRVFPALGVLKKSNEERVTLVNEAIVEELLLPVAHLDFGKGVVAKSSISLWRTRAEHVPLVGEFSFEIKFEKREEFSDKARAHAELFFVTLQHHAEDWISLGTTKTGVVYRLKGRAPQRLE